MQVNNALHEFLNTLERETGYLPLEIVVPESLWFTLLDGRDRFLPPNSDTFYISNVMIRRHRKGVIDPNWIKTIKWWQKIQCWKYKKISPDIWVKVGGRKP